MSEILSMIDPNNYGLQSMVAGGADLQEKTATPTTSQQVIQADEGYDGLSSVTVNAVTSAIDENIIPTNIRTGKTILGVQGNLEPDKPDQNKTVTPSTVQQVVVADTGYELAQVTVEAVPDETPELNAQDTALATQQTKIDELESALDNKIALDLQAATSDANATAGDIAKNKTAYVNGVKVTGVAENVDLSDYFVNTLSGGNYDNPGTYRLIKNIPNNLTFINNARYGLAYCSNLVSVPQISFSNVTEASSMFARCSSLINVADLDLTGITLLDDFLFRLYFTCYCTKFIDAKCEKYK